MAQYIDKAALEDFIRKTSAQAEQTVYVAAVILEPLYGDTDTVTLGVYSQAEVADNVAKKYAERFQESDTLKVTYCNFEYLLNAPACESPEDHPLYEEHGKPESASEFLKGERVIVTDPDYDQDFIGTVNGTHRDYLVVIDQEGNACDVDTRFVQRR